MLNPKLPISYGRQDINEADIQAVVNTLKADYLTGGPRIGEFEKKFADYIGAPYAVACSSGTAALHLCTLALGVKKGDKVITTPNTFVASANCVLYQGGEIDLVDIDPATKLMDLNALEKKLASSPKGTYQGIIPVDFAGHPIKMDQVRALADQHGCWVIEDSCHAPGGYYTDANGQVQQCGNGHFADLAIFSFHPVKHIATGEGGMVTTSRKELYDKMIQLRSHGITRDRSLLQEDHGGWYYEMQSLGYNYRLSDIAASLGISQLEREAQRVARRREIAATYDLELKDLPIDLPQNIEGHAYHLYVIETEKRDELYSYLRSQQIYPQIHYIPIHYQPYYKKLGWRKGDLSHAEAYYDRCLSIPLFPTLESDQLAYVVEKIRTFLLKN
ncbi:MAG: UDP-4-amino-4,6-dideoxy-N-acetyl-beta-L-altrosamine transaminase [Bacteroidota bacterium]